MHTIQHPPLVLVALLTLVGCAPAPVCEEDNTTPSDSAADTGDSATIDTATDTDTTDTATDTDTTDTATDTDTTDTGGTRATVFTFDESPPPTLTGFGDQTGSIAADPEDGTNMVAMMVKATTAATWAGTTMSACADDSIAPLPITATEARMAVRVWSPDAGIQVRLKVEDANDPTRSVETEATVTTAGEWELLTFDFTNEASGTAALNATYTFFRVSIFPNFDVDGATAGEKTYYVDDVYFLDAAYDPTCP